MTRRITDRERLDYMAKSCRRFQIGNGEFVVVCTKPVKLGVRAPRFRDGIDAAIMAERRRRAKK